MEMQYKQITPNHKIFYYDSNDPVIFALNRGALYGQSNYNLLQNFILEPGTIIDAGSHIGTFAFQGAINGQKLILIEAATKNLECLHKTFDEMENVSIYNAILLDSKKDCNFACDYGPGGMVTNDGTTNQKSSTIDSICENLHDRISAIKLDIEGSEPEAILGAKNTLARYKPPLLIEVNGHCLRIQNKKPTDLFNILDKMDYSYFIINSTNSIISINKQDMFPFCVIDIIAIHNDNIHKYLGNYHLLPFLEQSVLDQILTSNKSSANEDCEKYFNTLV